MLPTEDDEQAAVVQYLELKGATFTAIPNSTYTTSWAQKAKNKRLGLRAGFPDMVVVIKNTFFCIEMKRIKGGKISPVQAEWHEALKRASIPVHVCYGFDEAKVVIDKYAAGL